MYKRNPNEIYINPYCLKILSLHEANMDIQFVFDPFACAKYIVNYINKSDRGMSKLLKDAVEEVRKGNKKLRESFRAVENVFMNASEICTQEAIYSLMRMSTSKSSESDIYINTSLPHERVHILKSENILKSMSPDSQNIFATGLIDYYINRPDEKVFDKMSLAHFAAYYMYYKKIKGKQSEEQITEAEEEEEFENEHSNEKEEKQTDNRKFIVLKNNLGYIHKRKCPRVIRYRRYDITQDSENFYREQIMLFIPWRNEETDLLKINHESIFEKRIEEIKEESNKFNKLGKNIDFDDLLKMINEKEKNEEEEENAISKFVNPLEGFEYESQFSDVVHDIGDHPGITADNNIFYGPPLIPDKEYLPLIRLMNNDQRHILLHTINHFQTSDEPFYIFISGGAGVGKILLIKAIYQSLMRDFNSIPGINPDDTKILLCAPTGKAAFGIEGLTLHKTLGLPLSQAGYHMKELSASVANSFACNLANLKLIIIDEISMVGSRLFSLVNKRLQQIFHIKKDFAGISIIVVGDFRQLAPVGDGYIFLPQETSSLAILAGSTLWEKHFQYYELTKIMRQSDHDFATCLTNIAIGKMNNDNIKLINSRTFTKIPIEAEGILNLFATNDEVNNYNEITLAKYPSQGGGEAVAIDQIIGDTNEDFKKKLPKLLVNFLLKILMDFLKS